MNEPSAWERMLNRAERERDDALARLAKAEGVARTNAAWVQQQYAAAKEAREQRDAIQRQVDAVGSLTIADLYEAWHEEAWGGCHDREQWARVLAVIRAALGAVEPADQPHPTPKAGA